jgi:hypothetical protein
MEGQSFWKPSKGLKESKVTYNYFFCLAHRKISYCTMYAYAKHLLTRVFAEKNVKSKGQTLYHNNLFLFFLYLSRLPK